MMSYFFAATVLAILGTAVVYGTDVFCAVVLRPALARVDDRTLTAVSGQMHRYGDQRMPIPGVLGGVAAGLSAAFAAVDGRLAAAALAGVAFAALAVWLVLYLRVSAPINRQLTAAAIAGRIPPDVRTMQNNWDRVINVRAVLQGIAVSALCGALFV